MDFVRVTKVFTFEAGHFLYNYKGPCKNIHGHSYKLHVSVGGVPKRHPGDPEDGLVIDFKELKAIVNRLVTEKFDHTLIVNEHAEGFTIPDQKIAKVPFQPACENLMNYFAKCIDLELPGDIKLLSVKLFETESSYAERYAKDNE